MTIINNNITYVFKTKRISDDQFSNLLIFCFVLGTFVIFLCLMKYESSFYEPW